MRLADTSEITPEELQLAARNHGMPLEALRWPITPPGLHYLLTHYDVPLVDMTSWRLEVDGLVERPLSLSLDELSGRPIAEHAVTLECAGNGRARLTPRPISQPWLQEAVGTAVWRGTPLAGLLAEAGLDEDAVEVVFTGLDRGIEGGEEQLYQRSLGLHDALMPAVLLAWEMNGQPLPPQHGFPVRLVVPGWYGMASVKWLARIDVVGEPFRGYQMTTSYRLYRGEEGEEGEPVTRMLPRALMAPPGIPDFFTRERTVEVGVVELEGRAWSGCAPIAGVEVAVDGEAWQSAELERDVDGRWAWCRWRFRWDPPGPGEYVLLCRARDESGNLQPDEPSWNVGGFTNNAVQRVAVRVV